MFGKAQFAKSRKKKPFTSLILTWLSIMYEVCFLDTPPVLIGLTYTQNSLHVSFVEFWSIKLSTLQMFTGDLQKKKTIEFNSYNSVNKP